MATQQDAGAYIVKILFATYLITQILNNIILYLFVDADLRVLGYCLFGLQLWLAISFSLVKREPEIRPLRFIAGPIFLFLGLNRLLKTLLICALLSFAFLLLAIYADSYDVVWSAEMTAAQYFSFCTIYCSVCLHYYSMIKVETRTDVTPGVVLASPLLGPLVLFNYLRRGIQERFSF